LERVESYFTEKEEEIVRLLQEGKSIPECSKELGISLESAYMRVSRLKGRYTKAKNFVLEYEKRREKIPPRYL
jgi:DNA-binding CsgD family transcriptional regulator